MTAEREVRIENRNGLHARPAAEIVKAASRFRSDVTIRRDDMEVNGKSLSGGFERFSYLFPLPVLGVLLMFEGWTLLALLRDTAAEKSEFRIALLVGLMAVGLPYGYAVGLLTGTALSYATRSGRLKLGHEGPA